MAELNGQQIAAIEDKVRNHLAATIEKMKLRQWAVEKAILASGTESSEALLKITPSREGDAMSVEYATVSLANDIYNFVVTPALEPFKPD